MPNYLHRTTKQYQTSVAPQDLTEPEANYIQNPDMSVVAGEPSKYWVIAGDIVSLADQSTRDAIDAQLAADAVDAEKTRQKDSYTDNDIFRAQIKYTVDEINILRADAGLTPARTYSQAETYMFDAIDNEEV